MRSHQDRLVRIVASLLRDRDASREICQKAFLKLWECTASGAVPENVAAWLTRVALNLARNHLRDEARRLDRERSFADLQRASGTETPEHGAEDPRVHRLRQAIRKLPTQQRLVLTLLRQGVSFAQIAECLGISASTVRSHWQEARPALRAMIRPEEKSAEKEERSPAMPDRNRIGGVLPSETGTT